RRGTGVAPCALCGGQCTKARQPTQKIGSFLMRRGAGFEGGRLSNAMDRPDAVGGSASNPPTGRQSPVLVAPVPAAASTASPPGTATPRPPAATLALPRFVDLQRPTLELMPVKLLNGLLRVGDRAHLHEAEAA